MGGPMDLLQLHVHTNDLETFAKKIATYVDDL